MKWQVGVLAIAIVLAAVTAAYGQDEGRPSGGYFDCPYVDYFDPECPQARKAPGGQDGAGSDDRGVTSTVPDTLAPDDAAGAGEGAEMERERRRGLDAEELPLLFPKETLAPDAPPLLRRLLAEPTLVNARRYVRWYTRRTERLRMVQALIERAGREAP